MLLDDDLTRLRHIIDAAQEAIGYVEDMTLTQFQSLRPLQHSVVRCIEIIGEASNRITKELRDAYPQIPWVDIIGMRNRIVHAYYDIDTTIVWKTATEDLPVLLPEAKAMLRILEGR